MSHELFLLVKSLTKAEKGYFKKFAQRYSTNKGDNNYLLLFDAIDEQSSSGEYDEVRIAAKFKGRKMVKNLSVSKGYLMTALLKALRSYREGSHNALADINEYIENAQICFDKQLPDLGNKFLDKARRLALQEELFLKVADINYLKYRQVEWYIGEERLRFWEQLYTETQTMLRLHQNIADIINLNIIATQQQSQNRALRNDAEVQRIEALLQQPLLASPDQALSLSAKAHYHNTVFMLHYWLDHSEAAMTQLEALLGIMEQLPFGNVKSAATYMAVLVNYLTFCFQLDRFAQFDHYLQCLRTLPANTPTTIAMKFERYYGMAIRYADYTHNKTQGEILIREYSEQGGQAQQAHLNARRRVTTYGSIVAFWLKTRQFDQALDWIQRYQTELDNNLSPDLTAFMKIYYLLCHYELGNSEHLAYALRNTQNQLKSQDRLYELEQIMLHFFRQTLKAANRHEHIVCLLQLQQQIGDLQGEPLQKHVLNAYFDFGAWVSQKIALTALR